MYSTIARVRTEAGFDGNLNITDARISGFQVQAYGLVVSYISGVYNTTELVGVNFVGSQAELVLQRAEELLAAGYILIDQYGNNDLGGNKTARDRVNEGKSLLTAIIKGDIRLVGNDGEEFGRKNKSTSGGVVASSASTAIAANKFSVDDCY